MFVFVCLFGNVSDLLCVACNAQTELQAITEIVNALQSDYQSLTQYSATLTAALRNMEDAIAATHARTIERGMLFILSL